MRRSCTQGALARRSTPMDAINEKPLFGGGARGGARVSRLLHAVFGIDHYNGGHYLAKLPLPALLALRDDMSSMQELLQDAIAHKLQEAALPRAVIPVPEALLYDWLDPAVIHLLQSVGAAAASNTPQTNLFPEPTRVIPWHRFVTEEAPGVFSFPMFTPHACAAPTD
ncbi:hypothetical protein EON62_03895 [archaeon]|nr:MAG: hypothetical protein EON62_03895 [archaeon]